MPATATAAGPAGGNYDPYVALEFFKAAGSAVDIKEGKTIFAENEKAIPILRAATMYLLIKGEVGLFAGKKLLGVVKPGEIFGELAVISHAPRSASAIARVASTVIGLDDGGFHKALKKKPGFAVMLMSVMIRRLRESVAELKKSGGLAKDSAWKDAVVFDQAQIAAMAEGMTDDPALYRAGATIITEGSKGVRMYVVMEGRVSIALGGRMLERLGPGGVFGEAALVDGSTRLANAVAETDCELLPISRTAFLELVKLSPQFAQSMLASLSERLRFLTARLA